MKKIAFLLSLTLLLQTGCRSARRWESLSAKIAEDIPEMKTSEAGFSVTGTLVALPSSGELFIVGIGENRVFRSSDCGDSWERVDVKASGRTYGGYSVNFDPLTGGMIIFEVKKKNVQDPDMAMSRDAGKTWMQFKKPKLKKHDGFSWGMANWGDPEPSVILAKRHHGPPEQWLSADSGQTWRKLDFLCRNPGVIDSRTFVAGIDDSVKDVENGIYHSSDQGKTYKKVSNFVPTGKTPVRWAENFYWTVDDGVIVSRDAGKRWTHTGGKVSGSLWGPYFGRSENEMMLVGKNGFFVSGNTGKSWTKIHDFYVPGDPENIPKSYNVMHPCASFGWDPDRGYIYAATIWWTAEKLRVDLKKIISQNHLHVDP